MGTIAFLTMDSLEGFCSDDHLAVEAMRNLGWKVEEVAWRSGADWGRFDGVLVRTTWDYHLDPAGFHKVLKEIEASGTNLQNPISIIEWNMQKSYLLDLQKVVPVIPTVAGDRLAKGELGSLFGKLNADEIVIKPQVGAGAAGAWRLRREDVEATAEAEEYYVDRAYLAQPFIRSIQQSGEVSMIFFEDQLSHVVRKTPKEGDYRVQEEHGGAFHPFTPPEALLGIARRIMASLPELPLYARVDCVEMHPGDWALMELELIEPSLYFKMSPGSPERFAAAVDRRFRLSSARS